MLTPPPVDKICDPFDLYPLSGPAELETLVTLAVAVAGRSAKLVWPKVARVRTDAAVGSGGTPFTFFRALGPAGLGDYLREIRMGQYTRIGKALTAVAALPRGWGWRDLVGCHGISYKTAKLVQLYTWPGGRAACLDRHVLRLLARHPATRRKLGVIPPDSPSDPVRYAALEGAALWLADEYALAPYEFDRLVWRAAVEGRDTLAALTLAQRT